MPKPKKNHGSRAVPATVAPSADLRPQRSVPARVWIFRSIAALILPALVFAVLEGVLWMIGYGKPTSFFLPVRQGDRSVYIGNPDFGNRFFPPGLARQPQPFVFDQHKPPGTKRIFVLGESAAMGDPVPAFGLARVVEVLLRERYPGVHWEVINVAMTAINSHVIVPIARECAEHEGDVWVIYMGNNEVVGPFGGGTVFGRQAPPLFMVRLNLLLKSTRTGQLFANALGYLGGAAPKAWGGMEMFLNQQVSKDDPRMARVYSHFDANLAEIERLGRTSGAQVIVSSMAANLKDCAPFASAHRPTLTPDDLAKWEKEFTEGVVFQQSNQFQLALGCFQRAAAIDPAFADEWFRMGQCQSASDQSSLALAAYQQALELDTLRFRSDQRINQVIKDSCQAGQHYVDAATELSKHAAQGIPGDDLLYDHVHPSWEGNYWIGRSLAEQVSLVLPELKAGVDWLTMDQCAQRLALTAFDQFHTLDIVVNRMRQPPFTQQSNHPERLARWSGKATALKSRSTEFALETRLYDKQIAAAPEDWVLRINYARLLEAAGQTKEALNQWREAQKRLPKNPEIACAMGNNLDRLGKSAEAEAYFRDAIRLRPAQAAPYNDLGLCFEHQHKIQEAVECYQRAIALEPQQIEAHVNMAAAMGELGKNDTARSEFEKALSIRSNSPSAHLAMGKWLAKQSRTEDALAHFQQAVATAPDDPIAHYTLGNAYSALGRSTEALDHWTRALDLSPSLTEARLKMGLEFARLGRKTEAQHQFEDAVRRNPTHVDAQYNLAVNLAQQRRWVEAIEHFQEVLRLDPSNLQARKNLEAAVSLKNSAGPTR